MVTDTDSGNELQLMLDGKRPISVFYKVVGEKFDETSGQDFARHVRSGQLSKIVFYVNNDGQDFTIRYTVYALPSETWRAHIYKQLKLCGQKVWSPEMEFIERRLFAFGTG